MKKISVSSLIKFREIPPKIKLHFLNHLQKEKKVDEVNSGGNYWVSCLSAISNVFPYDDKNLLDDKIELLVNKIELTNHKPTKNRWQANIDVIHSFQEFDYDNIRPNSQITLLKKGKSSIVTINNIPVKAKPQFIFTFKNKGRQEIGAVWFVIIKNGYNASELGIFSEMIFRYLTQTYSENYTVNPEFCIAVDAYSTKTVTYANLINGDIPFLLDIVIDEINIFFSNNS